ncbi:MAG: LysM peptidoglycan-binding domain-containing protein [Chitinophagaceae bacterium]|nr:MAG: LysM peptidoglycan-binding domain-containing protein [Chitinophagaceae bacterium]
MTPMFRMFFCFAFLLSTENVSAQRMSVQEYVDTYKDAAIAQMKRLGVPASIILAQGILETESGNSDLVKRSNNHFGIKCKSNWTGMSVSHTDDAPNECFRKYNSAAESYADHSNYLYNTPRYQSLFKLSPTDYKGWAYGLKKAGYATNPRYPQILISNIERYNLQQYNADPGAEMPAESAIAITGVSTATEPATATQESNEGNGSNVFKKLFSSKKNKSNQFFNRLEAVMAAKGKSLLAIATEHDIALSKLLEYNDLEKDGLLAENQWIYLERKHKEGNRDGYTTTQRESLHSISQSNGVQLAMLAQYNNMAPTEVVNAGTNINLRPGLNPVMNAVASTKTMHEVQPKEGLYSIARKYNVTVDEIKQWNQLRSNDLKMGQQLIIAK